MLLNVTSYLKTVPIQSLNSLLSLINLLGIDCFIIKGTYRVKLTLAIVTSSSLIKMYQGNFFCFCSFIIQMNGGAGPHVKV